MADAPAAGNGGSSFSRIIAYYGAGYIFLISLGIIVFLSAIILAFYVCYRARRNSLRQRRLLFEGSVHISRDVESTGLEPAVIDSYAKFRFRKSERGNNEGAASLCSICLSEFQEEEMMRMMPDCGHLFHLCCIDEWLRINGSCPVCRSSPLPTPLSTPLAEVAPLSQNAADGWR